MHISFLTSEYPHAKFSAVGGIGAFVKTMADFLVFSGNEVTVFVCGPFEKQEIWYDGKIRIIEIKFNQASRLASIINRLKVSKIIKKSIKKFQIDILESADWEGLHSFCNLKIPLVTRIHGSVTYFSVLENNKPPFIIRFFENLAFKKSRAIVSVSKYSAEVTSKLFNVDIEKIKIIYNGVDVDKFIPINEIKSADINVLYFGTLVRKKGVLELPYVFNELWLLNNKINFILIGKDTIDVFEKKSTWEIIKSNLLPELLDKTKYLGVIPYQEISKYIDKATVCVFPSFAEAFPISWLEALAMGKPIVASNIGWSKESIENNVSGFLVDPKNHKLYAEKINEIVLNNDLAVSLSKNARLRVLNKFDQKNIINLNIDFYKSLIN